MPFTLSHPALVAALWPVVRRAQLPLAAVAIGAMTPDFEFFLHLRPYGPWGHSLAGLVTFCAPAGLAVLAAWELVVRDPTRDLLGLVAGAGLAVGLWNGTQRDGGDGYWDTQLWLGRIAVGAMLGCALALLGFAVAYRRRAAHRTLEAM